MLCYRRQPYSQITIICVTCIPTIHLEKAFVNVSLITKLDLLFYLGRLVVLSSFMPATTSDYFNLLTFSCYCYVYCLL